MRPTELATACKARATGARRVLGALPMWCRWLFATPVKTLFRSAVRVADRGSSNAFWRRPTRSYRVLVRAFVANHEHERAEQDLEIEQPAPVAQVLEVVFDAAAHVLEIHGFAAAAADLSEAGDSRRHLVADHIAG